MKIRASLGTLMSLGLVHRVDTVEPSIAYIMQYSPIGCKAGCLFCTQSLSNKSSKELLSRVVWPVIDLNDFMDALTLTDKFKRVCLQTIIKENFIKEAHNIIKEISGIGRKISLSITPVPYNELIKFRSEGVDYLGVGLDAFSEDIFIKVKKPFSWQTYWKFIDKGVKAFGKGKVVVHLIVGLGEKLNEALRVLERIYKLGAEVSLFAYTPVKGTYLKLKQPNYVMYRLLQLVAELLSQGYRLSEIIEYRNGNYLIKDSLIDRDILVKALITRGCPECNRPYYNESPRAEPYNFPSTEMLNRYMDRIKKEIRDIST